MILISRRFKGNYGLVGSSRWSVCSRGSVGCGRLRGRGVAVVGPAVAGEGARGGGHRGGAGAEVEGIPGHVNSIFCVPL